MGPCILGWPFPRTWDAIPSRAPQQSGDRRNRTADTSGFNRLLYLAELYHHGAGGRYPKVANPGVFVEASHSTPLPESPTPSSSYP